jgi:hypothetical protein
MKSHGAPGTPIAISTSLPPAKGAAATTIPVRAVCPGSAALGVAPASDKHAAPVVNAILDYTASGPANLQVGVVVVDAKDAAAFMANPLTYVFQGTPSGKPARTYASSQDLDNAGEAAAHVAGTFPYDEVKLTLATYDMNKGKQFGTPIAGKAAVDDNEYVPAVDTHSIDYGNYGVFYEVTIPTTGVSGQAAQVLINPRAVGSAQKGVTSAFSGLADVPAPASPGAGRGRLINLADKGQPGEAKGVNLTDNDYGIGIGRVAANSAFTFEMMPPGGASLPVAIVLAPAYARLQATLTYDGDKHVSSSPDPQYVPIVP